MSQDEESLSPREVLRWSGLANIAAGILVATFLVLHPERHTSLVLGGAYEILHLTGVLSVILALLGLVGLYAIHVDKGGYLGFAGFLLAFAGTTLRGAVAFFDGFMVPILAAHVPELLPDLRGAFPWPAIAVFPLTSATFILGFLLFGIMLLRVDLLPHPGAILIMLGAPLLGLGPLSLPLIVPQAGSLLFGAGQIWLGAALWKRTPLP